MSLIIRSATVCLFLPWGLAALTAGPARAETPQVLAEEVREFEVLVSEKPIGTNQIRITETDDGATTVSTEVSVKFDFVVYVYRYELHSKETWQGDELTKVDNRANSNGTRYLVRAKLDPTSSLIEAGGKPAAKGPALEMTTNFWRRPTSKEGLLSFLDVDKGIVLTATMDHIGREPFVVAGDRLDCNRYRLRGTVEADLWYDSRGRLVRQQTVEMGYPTELRLVRLTAKGAAIARR
jgi:hypothetical protein